MARARKSHVEDEENAKASGRLSPAYSPKVNGHKYVIYAQYQREGDKHVRSLVLKFLATYAARFMVLKLIANDNYELKKWMHTDDVMAITDKGLIIRAHGTQIKEILDYEPTDAEASWKDEQVISNVARFKFGPTHADLEVRARHVDDAGRDDVPDERDGADYEPASSKRGRKAEGPKREARPKVDTSGYVSANDIANELKTEGRIVRGALRGLGLVKPEHGWSWPKAEAKGIVEQIKAQLKKEGKKK